MARETVKMGKRGTVVIPRALREYYGLVEGEMVVAESRPEGILLRPMVMLPIEIYSLERKAQFLLNNAVTAEDYSRAMDQVRQLGLDPEKVPHERPEGI